MDKCALCELLFSLISLFNNYRSFALDEIGLKLGVMVIRITNPLAGNQRYDRDRYDKIWCIEPEKMLSAKLLLFSY